MTCFRHWTQRVTDGTEDLFWLDALLVGKDERDGSFTLSIFDPDIDDFLLYEKVKTRKDWEIAYRKAREIINEQDIDCRSFRV